MTCECVFSSWRILALMSASTRSAAPSGASQTTPARAPIAMVRLDMGLLLLGRAKAGPYEMLTFCGVSRNKGVMILRTLRFMLTIAAIAAVPAAVSAAQARPAPAAPQAAAPAAQPTAALDENARDTRERLRQILDQYPPTLGQVLRLDPTLITRADYLAPYPTLANFLAVHPEVAHNPSFFIGQAVDRFTPEYN